MRHEAGAPHSSLDDAARALDALLAADWAHPALQAELLADGAVLASLGQEVPFGLPVADPAAGSLTGDKRRDADLMLRGLKKRRAE